MSDLSQHRPFAIDLSVFIAGALLPLAFAPFGFWPLAMLLPIVLLWSWDDASTWRAAARGGLFGLGAFGFGIYWIFISLHDYGNAPAVFAALATFSVMAIMALYPTVLGYLIGRWGPPPGPIRWLLVVPALWALSDWIRSWLLTGFPWLAIGYSQTDSPLGDLAPYVGVFGVGWAVLLNAGLLRAMLASDRWSARWLWLGILAASWLGSWGLGRIDWVEPAGAPLRVALAQGNITQDQKWRSSILEETLRRYVRLSLAEHGRADVIIWPETALPIFQEEAHTFLATLAEDARRAKIDYVIGIPSGSRESRIFHNSVIIIGRSPGTYHKRRLLPFGEYLPLRAFFQFFRGWVDIPMADFTPGERDQPLPQAGGQPVGVSICFEAVFGNEIRLALPEATWLINVSNDAWFKNSIAPHQHLQIVRMRALEMGRYLARATNTGISAVLDEHGRILSRGDQFQAEIIPGKVRPLRGLTPYGRFGDVPVVVLLLILLGVGLWLGRSGETGP